MLVTTSPILLLKNSCDINEQNVTIGWQAKDNTINNNISTKLILLSFNISLADFLDIKIYIIAGIINTKKCDKNNCIRISVILNILLNARNTLLPKVSSNRIIKKYRFALTTFFILISPSNSSHHIIYYFA